MSSVFTPANCFDDSFVEGIVHMPAQYGISYFILPYSLPAIIKLLLLLVGTMGISLLIYEYCIKCQ